ncbi:MAG: hypothetical protein LE180_03345 [Endomicrobium sp.]|uniref:hypothetical protein n=1 Tax=Candidatus Endomicrobiellum pyrsonymphae TaxID=1408203 RepID=UPI00357E5418|nr:hypothetical protein [Endomicrobium sp.]
MMTLRLRRCVSLFVCFSLLVSACSSDKSNKNGNSVNRNSVVGGVDGKKEEKVAAVVDGRRWWKPTWATGPTGLGVGTVAGIIMARRFKKEGDGIGTKSLLFGAGVLPVMVAGEAARAVILFLYRHLLF